MQPEHALCGQCRWERRTLAWRRPRARHDQRCPGCAESWGEPPALTREVCKDCGCESGVGFSVPDEVWREVMRGPYYEPGDLGRMLCIGCFVRRADERFVQWDREIQFFPVSLRTHQDLEDAEPSQDSIRVAAWRVVLWHRRVAHGLGTLEPGLGALLEELAAELGECPADVSKRVVTEVLSGPEGIGVRTRS